MQMRAFEDRFLTIGLPYRVIGGPRFYERMEIRDAMAYFRLVTRPRTIWRLNASSIRRNGAWATRRSRKFSARRGITACR